MALNTLRYSPPAPSALAANFDGALRHRETRLLPLPPVADDTSLNATARRYRRTGCWRDGHLQALEATNYLAVLTPSGELRLFDGKPASGSPALRQARQRPSGMRRGSMHQFNDEPMQCAAGQTAVSGLLIQLNQLKPRSVGAQSADPPRERQQQIVQEGDQILCFSRVGSRSVEIRTFIVLNSHLLFIGTGKFASSQLMVEAICARSQLVTLAMKRVDLRQHNDVTSRAAH